MASEEWEWRKTVKEVLAGWDGKCFRCGKLTNRPKVHHVEPALYQHSKVPRWIKPTAGEVIGVPTGMKYIVVCLGCHSLIHFILTQRFDGRVKGFSI